MKKQLGAFVLALSSACMVFPIAVEMGMRLWLAIIFAGGVALAGLGGYLIESRSSPVGAERREP